MSALKCLIQFIRSFKRGYVHQYSKLISDEYTYLTTTSYPVPKPRYRTYDFELWQTEKKCRAVTLKLINIQCQTFPSYFHILPYLKVSS